MTTYVRKAPDARAEGGFFELDETLYAATEIKKLSDMDALDFNGDQTSIGTVALCDVNAPGVVLQVLSRTQFDSLFEVVD